MWKMWKMWKNPILVFLAFLIAPHLGYGQEAKTVLDGVSKACLLYTSPSPRD